MPRRRTLLKVLAIAIGVMLAVPLLVIIGSWIAVRKELAAVESDIATHQQPVPEQALRAVVAIEAPRFDPSSLAHRLVRWNVAGRGLKQQYQSLVVTLIVELRGDRREIATAYANLLYVGKPGGRPRYGIREGSLAYFGRPLEQLTPAQLTALLACFRAPAYLAPTVDSPSAAKRRCLVLRALAEQAVFSAEETPEAAAQLSCGSPNRP